MSFTIGCDSCGARFALPTDLYERKVRGRIVTIRCKRCGGDITVDDAQLVAGTYRSKSDAPPKRAGRMGSSPAILPTHDETPTVPLTFGTPHDDDMHVEELWVVSFSDDDDRELTAEQIGGALERQEIDRETIVWREGMSDWLPIEAVPELAGVLRAAAPPISLPSNDINEIEEAPISAAPISLEPESLESDAFAAIAPEEPGPRALSPGTLFVDKAGKAPPAPKAAPRPPAPRATTPRPPGATAKPPLPRPKSASVESPKPPAAARTAKRSLPTPPPAVRRPMPTPPPSDDDAPPSSSGTPALTSLAASRVPRASTNERADDDILGLGTGTLGAPAGPPTIDSGPPTIDIDVPVVAAPVTDAAPQPEKIDFEPPTVDVSAPVVDAPKSAKLKPAPERPASGAEPAPSGPGERKGGAAIRLLLATAAAAFGGWWFFVRAPAVAPTPQEDATNSTTEPAKTDDRRPRAAADRDRHDAGTLRRAGRTGGARRRRGPRDATRDRARDGDAAQRGHAERASTERAADRTDRAGSEARRDRGGARRARAGAPREGSAGRGPVRHGRRVRRAEQRRRRSIGVSQGGRPFRHGARVGHLRALRPRHERQRQWPAVRRHRDGRLHRGDHAPRARAAVHGPVRHRQQDRGHPLMALSIRRAVAGDAALIDRLIPSSRATSASPTRSRPRRSRCARSSRAIARRSSA